MNAPEPQPPKSSFWRSLRIVAWGLLGVRKRSQYQQDLSQANPLHIAVAGLIAVLLLVLLLVGIAHWAVSSAAAA